MKKLLKAARFAALKHSTQRRKDADATPYINHPIAVAEVLADVGGVTDEDLLCAALLHDTIEDTETSPDELKREFGERVLSIVLEVTDDKSLPKKKRKQLQVEHAPHRSSEAQQLKLADKISNLRSIVDEPPVGWSQERCDEYFDWAKQVIDGVRGVNPALEKLFDELYAQKP